jgi:signal transduction histidine kinase
VSGPEAPPRRILVVEDEGILVKDLTLRLGRMGYVVDGTAATGEDAVRLARERRPDLILMDVMLRGELDGIEAARLIEPLGIPVVYLTAYADETTIARATRTGPFAYLVKPFEDGMLKTAVEVAFYKSAVERRLRHAHEDLDRRVRERTRELAEANERLRVEAERRLQAKADLERIVTIASHDLKEPIRNTITHVELLARQYGDSLEPEAHEIMETAVRGARRLDTLVEALRRFVHAARSRAPRKVDAGDVLRTVLEELDEGWRARVSASSLPELWADPLDLGLVFRNLLSAALEGTEGTVEVRGGGEDGTARLSFEMPEPARRAAMSERLFVLFHRARRDDDAETHLGLAICKRIVEAYGGTLGASGDDARARVELTWPAEPQLP